jgi:tetratricopeptide (TPR) repeat protein
LQVTYFLATALFQQCLNAEKDPVMIEALAKRAEPLFAELFESELSEEVAQAFAHLCCVLRHYDRASEIYLSLARNRDRSSEETGELLFQAALLQSEYDPELAIKTFSDIDGGRAKEASYHRLLLLFRAGRYEEFLAFQGEVPADKGALMQLHRGQSYAALGQYPEAITELSKAIADADQRYAALSSLLDTAHAAGDLDTFQTALGQLVTNYPGDSKEPSARFAYAQLLKRAQRMTEARTELEMLFGQVSVASEEGAHIAFELAHLDFQEERWEECRARALHFLSHFGESSLAPYVWHYLASSSLQLNRPEQLAVDVERLLAQPALFSEEEKSSWQLILAKTYLELQRYDAAITLLEPFAESHPNAQFLLALCARDGKKDLSRFCTLAEGALTAADFSMADRGQIHLALFDAYLERGEPNQNHLYQAFLLGASICRENLEWLADFYFKQVEERAEFADPYFAATRDAETLERAMRVTESLVAQGESNTLLSRLGRIYALCGESDRQVALLESSEDPELRLWLADGYRAMGQLDEALTLYDALTAESVTLRQFVGAKACLEAARIRRATHPDQAAVQLKSLMVQRHLSQEPIYLDAAMEYADLVTTSPEKRLTVLNKIRFDFESQTDLLSQDYHRARAQLPKKDELYRAYLQLIDAEILFCRSQWMEEEWVKKAMQTEAKGMLQTLLNPSQPASLTARAQRALDKMNE